MSYPARAEGLVNMINCLEKRSMKVIWCLFLLTWVGYPHTYLEVTSSRWSMQCLVYIYYAPLANISWLYVTRKKTYQQMWTKCLNRIWKAAPNKIVVVLLLASHSIKFIQEEQDILDTFGEIRTKSGTMSSNGLPDMNTPVLADQKDLHISDMPRHWTHSRILVQNNRG